MRYFADENLSHEGLTAGDLSHAVLNWLFHKSKHRRVKGPKSKKPWPDFRDAYMVGQLEEFGWTEANGKKHPGTMFMSRAFARVRAQALEIILEELKKGVDALGS